MGKQLRPMLVAALIACGIMLMMCAVSGVDISSYNYPSYQLQSQAWLRGETHLDQNYEFLELAVYDGKYYVSFPPVPSVPMVLWTLVFGGNVPGGLLQKIYVLVACLLILGELMRDRRMGTADCIAWAVLMTLGSAMLPVQLCGGVWYEAQILAFLFSVGAVVAIRRKRIVIACLSYALAVGCRPFSVLMGPVLLMMYMQGSRKTPVKERWRRLVPGIVAGLCVAAVYGWYNYIRFGNPFEFGHNYLPEFTRSEHGQISLAYLRDNLKIFLFGAPFTSGNGAVWINQFGFSLFLSCPVFICMLVWAIQDLIRREFSMAKATVLLMFALNIVLLCMHKTLGGHQFGARYALEMVPMAFAYLLMRKPKAMAKWECVLMCFGLAFNFWGGCLVHV